MSGKVRQRGILALIIYFLMITAIWAPIAFYTGRARGETEAQKSAGDGKNLFHSETGASLSETGPAIGEGDMPLARPLAVGEAILSEPAAIAAPVRRGRATRSAPLRDAVLRTLAENSSANGGSDGQTQPDGTDSTPINLALAPSLPSLTGVFGGGQGGGQSGGQGGAVSPPNGYPGALIPGFIATGAPPGGGPEQLPPDLVTPVPAALPLMLTGLGGLFAAARRRRSR